MNDVIQLLRKQHIYLINYNNRCVSLPMKEIFRQEYVTYKKQNKKQRNE